MFFNKSKKLLVEAELQLQTYQLELQKAKDEAIQLNSELHKSNTTLVKCSEDIEELKRLYSPIIDINRAVDEKKSDLEDLKKRIVELNEKYKDSLEIHNALEKEVSLYEDSLEIGSFGLYKPRYTFETSEKFKEQIEANYEMQKQVVKDDKAAVCYTEWTVGGSIAEGRRMTNQYKKLMLLAFNGECDGLIAKVRWNNADKTEERIRKAYTNINKLGVTQQVELTGSYLKLKLDELALTYEYEQKKYEEKEEQRRIREQMREEEKALRELERAQKEAEDEERRFQKALEKARMELNTAPQANIELLNDQIKTLEQKLSEVHDKKERALAMAQLTKVGHIYVISNLGSFGEDVFKIGMTRRLDPIDRVRELGDASVPFLFDVHAIIYSENAPQLEYEIHQNFSTRRINRVNHKKEFFKVTLEEIAEFIKQKTNGEIEFTMLAEAREYRETIILLESLAKPDEKKEINKRFPDSII